jgi:protein-tyrosine phosphatase
MAEALLRHHLNATELSLPVSSAGTLGWNSAGATDHTVTALQERGVSLQSHVSRRMNAGLISAASLVVTMTNDHADAVRNHYADAAPRTFVLGQLVRLGERRGPRGELDFDRWLAEVDQLRDPARRRALPRDEIRDPLGEPLEAYQLLAAQLDDLTGRLAHLIAGPKSANSAPGMAAVSAVGQDGLN